MKITENESSSLEACNEDSTSRPPRGTRDPSTPRLVRLCVSSRVWLGSGGTAGDGTDESSRESEPGETQESEEYDLGEEDGRDGLALSESVSTVDGSPSNTAS